LTGTDLYQAYEQDNVIGGNPLQLVVALYEGAIDATVQALDSFETGDAFRRSKFISKAVSILTELMLSLDHDKGGEISANLKRLYSYMQCRLLEAHAQKNPEPVHEVKRLLNEVLEAWQKVAERSHRTELVPAEKGVTLSKLAHHDVTPLLYDSYLRECPDHVFGEVYSF
jgi:flagellar secretion chaperone FliS